MGKVADIINAPEFAQKSPVEKAQARRDLFAVTLDEHPEIKQMFDSADPAGKQKLVDQFKAKLDADFPTAFKTPGWSISIGADGSREVFGGYEEVATKNGAVKTNKWQGPETPVYDVGTEQMIRAAADPANHDKFAALPEAQRHALAPFLYERYGPDGVDPSLFGKPEDFIQKEKSGTRKALEFAVPALFRLAPPLVASVTKNPRIVALAAGAGDAAAQSIEQSMGTRDKFSAAEMGLNTVLAAIPAATVREFANPALNMAARVGVRSVEGAAQGAIFEGARQLADDGKFDAGKLGISTAFGAGLGSLVGAFEPKIAALLAGKNADDALATLKTAAEKAGAEERASLTAAQKRIEEMIGVSPVPTGEQTASRQSDVTAAVALQDAEQAAQTRVNSSLGVEQPNPELDALKRKLSSQETEGTSLRAEQDVRALEAGIRRNQVSDQPYINPPGETPTTTPVSPKSEEIIGDVLQQVKGGKSSNSSQSFAAVTPAAARRIFEATGVDVAGREHRLSPSTVVHSEKGPAPGELKLTDADWQFLPSSLEDFDSVEKTVTNRGEPALTFTKRVNGFHYAVEVINNENSAGPFLTVKTFSKLKDAPGPRVSGENQSLGLTSENDGGLARNSVGDDLGGVKLSPQAQRVHDEYGFVAPRLATSLAGGVGGFVYGTSTGDDPVDRVKRGLIFGVMGAAGGYMLGRRFLATDGATPLRPGMSVLGDVDKVLSQPSGPTFGSKIAGIPQNLRTSFVTKFAPLDAVQKQVMDAAGKPMPAVPLARKFEQVAGAGGKALVDVRDFEAAILPTVAGNERDFDRLLFLKRTGQRLQQDVNDAVQASQIQAIPPESRSPDEKAFMDNYAPNRRRVADWDLRKVDAGLAQLASIVGAERFAELDQLAAGAFQQELDRSLQLQVSSGRISQEAYDAIKASNDFYAPFRVFRALEDIDAGRMPPGIDTRKQIVNAITGIDDAAFHVDSPTKAAAENIFNGRVLAQKNLKMQELAKLADDDPNGAFVRKLKSWEKPRREFETVNYFEGGAPMRLEVAPDVAQAVKGLNSAQTGVAAEMFKRAGSVARFGATSANLAFQVRNLAFADQPRLLLMSKYGLNGGDVLNPLQVPVDFATALLSSIKSNVLGKTDDLSRAFYESGAAGSTLQDSISRMGDRFSPGGLAGKSRGAVRDVLDKFEDMTRVLEETTKLMGFRRGVRLEGLDNLPPEKAAAKLDEIVTEVRNFAGSPDFARGGNVAKDLSMLTLFFNARVQGNVSDISRLAGADGAKAALGSWARIGVAVGVPAAYFWLRNHEPENIDDFKKVPSWETSNYEMIPRYDDKGAPLYFTNAHGEKIREYWRIPKRESVQHIANLADAAMDFAHSKDPQAVADFAGKFIENAAPINISGKTGTERMESAASGLNPLLKLPTEVMTNRDFFRHRDIVPQNRQEASPENQYYAGSTPQGYVNAAQSMPQFLWDPLRSPLMLRHIVGGFTGGLINQFANDRQPDGSRGAATAALADNPVGRVFVRSSTNDSEEEIALAKDAQRGAADRRVELDNAAMAELDALAKLPAAQKEARLREIARTKPEMINPLVDEAEARAMHLTQPDRLARRMPVKDGTRAHYIVERFKRLPVAERENFLRDQAAKGIATSAVLDQVAEILSAGKN